MFEKSFDFFGFKQGEKFINEEYPEISSVSIITDENAANYLKACPKLVAYRTEIVDIFIKFQIKYQSGYYFKNQHQYNRNNNDVVDHFCNGAFLRKTQMQSLIHKITRDDRRNKEVSFNKVS